MFESKIIFTNIPIILVKKTLGTFKLLDTSRRLDSRFRGLIQNSLQASNKDIITLFFNEEDQLGTAIFVKVDERFDNKDYLDLGVKIYHEISKLQAEQFHIIDETNIENIANLIYLGIKNAGLERTHKIQENKKLISIDHKHEETIALSEGIKLAQFLTLEPANILTPDTYVDLIKKEFSKVPNVTVSVLDANLMKAYGMNSLLAVGAASNNGIYTVIIEMNKPVNSDIYDPICLIGKGITFDSGGLCLKPSRSMLGMHTDMAGSATVVGTIKSLALAGSNQHVIGILGIAENLIGSLAYKPGDIITTTIGSIEIVDTDAEGRLVLADLLLYAQGHLGVKRIIDIATLTGAASIALGDVYAPLFANNYKLAADLEEAGKYTGEFVYPMPLSHHYNKLLKSQVADFVNVTAKGYNPGATVGALFLSKFIFKKDVIWAHIDIGGMNTGDKLDLYHFTGVPLLYRYVTLSQ